MTGATPSGSGCQPTASAAIASSRSGIPSAWEREAADTARLGERYRAIQAKEYGCGGDFECAYPHDGNCWCFNTALAQHVAQAMSAGTAKTEGLGPQDASAIPAGDAP